MRIEEIDKNLKVETALGLNDVVFADVRHDPFRVYGLYDYKNQPVFRRLPEDIAAATNDGVKGLASHTAGGRVRFSTDSPYIAIRCKMNSITHFSHMPLIGTSGFDLYEHKNGVDCYIRSYMPPYDMKNGYESVQYVSDGTMKDYTIHFPLYNDVISLEIGLKEGSALTGGPAYADLAPIVYYGSSITQGGCASRPGNAYQNIISAHRNIDHINLGFSGSARAEDVIVEYMAGMKMSLFVCDYDHNAPTADHLEATHEKLYRTIRAKNPDLPIIFVSKPDNWLDKEAIRRRDIVYRTYLKAYEENPARAGYIDGYSLFGAEFRDCCTVDTCHPNDAGFVRMAEVIGHEIDRLLRL
ncbi:MAG: SGNH/GDSL hydrolase family protein [Clostridia bacterium]|nr:SGNH/GDSL hydrolase family protein [Clostridia bacterium]